MAKQDKDQWRTTEFFAYFTEGLGSEQDSFQVSDLKYRAHMTIILCWMTAFSIILYWILGFLVGMEYELKTWMSLMRDFVIVSIAAPLIIKKLKSINIAVLIIMIIITDLTYIVMDPKQVIMLVLMFAMNGAWTYLLTLNNYITAIIWIMSFLVQNFLLGVLKDELIMMFGVNQIGVVWAHSMALESGIQLLIVDLFPILLVKNHESIRKQMIGKQQLLIQKAEIAVKTKDMFIAAMSHEFRNPLNSLICCIEMLQEQCIQHLTIKCREYIHTMHNWGQILLHLINNVLDVSKLQSDTLDLAISPWDIRKLLINLLNVNKSLALRKNIDLGLSIDKTLPKLVMSDGPRLSQVLINIISNAIKFTDSGYVNVRVYYEPTIRSIPVEKKGSSPVSVYLDEGVVNKLKIGNESTMDSWADVVTESRSRTWLLDWDEMPCLHKFHEDSRQWVRDCFTQTEESSVLESMEDPYVHKRKKCRYGHETEGLIIIEIQDTGIGISREGISKLFKPFGQVDKSICQRFGGTGLGLWLSQQIIDLFKGNITVDSVQGKGSCFTVSFPVQIAPDHNFANSQEIQPPLSALQAIKDKIRGSHILIAEDIAYNQMVIAGMIEQLDWQVTVLSNGLELIEYYSEKADTVDAILSDVDMPKMDGMTAIQCIRQFEEENDLPAKPCIMLTGNSTRINRNLSKQAGANDFLTKPLDLHALAHSFMATIPNSHTALIIDDDLFVLEVHKQLLSAQGLKVKTNSNPQNALEAIKSGESIDMILIDHNMPWMSGLEFTWQLRQWQRENGKGRIPILICSGDVRPGFRDECFRSGVNLVLTKPISRIDLKDAIDSLFK